MKNVLIIIAGLAISASTFAEDISVEDNSFEISGGATGVLQGAPSVDTNSGAFEASLSVDIEIVAQLVNCGKIHAHLETGTGAGIDDKYSTLSGFNDDADDDIDIRLTELWYEHMFLENKLAVKIGKIDIGGPCGCNENAFDANAVANDECGQFLSGGFVNTLAMEGPADNGYGITLWASPHELLDIGIGVTDADGGWENMWENTFAIFELDFKPTIKGQQGNYRIYFWKNNMAHTELLDATQTNEVGHGIGVSFDQEITETATVFLRYAQEDDDIYQISKAWSVGLGISGELFGRDNDMLGLAYGRAIIGDDQLVVDFGNGVNSGDESHIEAYYSFELNEDISISPNIQWIQNPDGDTDNDSLYVFGLRAQVQF